MKPEERKLVNAKQKEFYDTKQKNAATRLWSYFRNGTLNRIKKDIGVERDIYELHKSWFGDLSEKKVLDLGCYAGNSLSFYLAQNSKEYLGIDLSPKGINNLSRRLGKISGARAEVKDFLSEEFKEGQFDLIYAYGVLHHFKDTEELIDRLKQKLNAGGRIISYDPLETSFPVKLIRTLYRPFQSDKDWEWPFTKKVFHYYAHEFRILDRRAVFGKSKWIFLLNLLPISEEKKNRIGKKWHDKDWERSSHSNRHLFSCMHLSMLMQKKED